MKQIKSILLLTILPGFVATATAAITLIDNSTLNGSFENGTGTTTATSWTSATGHVLQRQATYAQSGTWSLVIGRDFAGTTLNGAAINTGYSITTGASFVLNFYRKGAFNADATDQVAWKLFTTSDNTFGGTPTILFGNEVSLIGATSNIATSPYNSTGDLSTSTVGAGDVGKTLFLSFTPGTGFANDEFARIDSINLSVVPEPALPSMLGLAGSLWLIRRRRIG